MIVIDIFLILKVLLAVFAAIGMFFVFCIFMQWMSTL